MAEGYTYDNAWAEERKRLDGIEAQFDAGTIDVLKRVGIAPEWTCLEVGAGGGSIARWLCERARRVVATDLDPRFVAVIDAPNLEARRHDIVAEPLEENAFDLVHSRMVLEHLPGRDAVLRKLIAALKSGGWLVLEDLDASIVDTPLLVSAFPATRAEVFGRVNRGVIGVMRARGFDPHFARRLPGALQALDLASVGAVARSDLVYGGSAAAAFARWTMVALRDALVAAGPITADDVDEAVRLADDPGFSWLRPPIIAAWGRKSS